MFILCFYNFWSKKPCHLCKFWIQKFIFPFFSFLIHFKDMLASICSPVHIVEIEIAGLQKRVELPNTRHSNFKPSLKCFCNNLEISWPKHYLFSNFCIQNRFTGINIPINISKLLIKGPKYTN